MKTIEDSRALGRSLVDTTRAAGRQATGWITDMSRPLGRAVGNALEADESIRVLRGEGPKRVRGGLPPDGRRHAPVREAVALRSRGARRLSRTRSPRAGRPGVFEKSIEFQGGDPKVVEDPSLLPQPKKRIPAAAPRSGFVRSIQTEKMGFLSIDIGCGRAQARGHDRFRRRLPRREDGRRQGRKRRAARRRLSRRPAASTRRLRRRDRRSLRHRRRSRHALAPRGREALEFGRCSTDSIACARPMARRRCCGRRPGSTTRGKRSA